MITIFFLFNSIFAGNCPTEKEILGPYRIRGTEHPNPLGCVVDVGGNGSEAKTHRNFNFYKNGQLMVATIFDKVNSPTFHKYFIFPANDSPKIKNLGLAVQVQDTAGLHWNFDEKGSISVEEKCNLKVNPKITAEGEAAKGFNLVSCPGSIIIDSGFSRSKDPATIPNGTSEVRDPKGVGCTVTNSELFDYKIAKGDAVIRYKSSTDLKIFLQNKPGCEKLDLSPLSVKGSAGAGREAQP